MLMVAKINSNKKIKMTEEEEKLFGIDKLNIKRSNIPAITHVDYHVKNTNSVKKTQSKIL